MIKIFESFISHSSKEAIENPLNDFSKKLKDVITDSNFISETEYKKNSDFIVRQQFLNVGYISIYIYFKGEKLFSIKLNIKDNDVMINITTYNNWQHVDTSIIVNILDIIKDSSILVDKHFSKYRISVDDMYDIIENIEIYNNSIKYNI